MMLACAGIAFGADGFTMEMHRYSPDTHAEHSKEQSEEANSHGSAAAHPDEKSIRECTGQVHAPKKHCRLIAWLADNAGEEAKKTSFTIRDIKIDTVDRDEHAKKKDLEQYLIKKTRVVCRDAGGGVIKNNFKVVSVSGTDLLKYLDIPAGNLSITAVVGLAPKGSNKAEVFLQTTIHLVYRDKKEKKEAEETTDDEDEEEYYGEDEGDMDDSEDSAEDAAEKRKEAQRKAKAKALREKIKKFTAFVDPKERSNDKDVAVASAEDEQPQEGPNALSILLLMAAAAAAAVFGYLIRSDIKVMRWYKQKKALRRK